jgi:hypothetical protein
VIKQKKGTKKNANRRYTKAEAGRIWAELTWPFCFLLTNKNIEMKGLEKILAIVCCVVMFAGVPFGIGIYSLVIALPSRNTHIGTLTHARTWEYCDKGCTWLVVDVFQKGNSSRTCEIERKEKYDHESRANHVVERTVLGTQRRIWEYPNDAHTCYDEGIRKSSFFTAIICLSIVAFCICCPFVSFLSDPNDSFWRDDEVTGENTPAANTTTANAPTADLGCDVGRDGYKLTLVFDLENAESEPVVHLAENNLVQYRNDFLSSDN